MDHLKISARGGNMTKAKYPETITLTDGRVVNKHFHEMGQHSNEVKLKKYGTDYWIKLSALGVAARKAKAEKNKSLGQKIVDTIASI